MGVKFDPLLGQLRTSDAGGASIGGAVTSGTSGSVLYIDGSGNLAQDNSDLYWDASNKILEVNNGYIKVTKTGSAAQIIINRTDGKKAALAAAGGGSIFSFLNTGFFAIYATDSSSIDSGVYTSGEVFRITASGLVGVGTSPVNLLDLYTTSAQTGSFYGIKVNNQATSSAANAIKAGIRIFSLGTWNGTGATNIGLYVSSVSGGTTNYDAIFNGGGNVGIGTMTPGGLLDVTSTTLNTQSTKQNVQVTATGTLKVNANDTVIAGSTAQLSLGRLDSGDVLSIWASNGTGNALAIKNFTNSSTLFSVSNAGAVAFTYLALRGAPAVSGIGLAVQSASAPYVAVNIYANSGQTANLTEWKNSSGAVLTAVSANGSVGIGESTPTAYLHLKAGTATASTAPIKLTAGTNLTTPENGAIEFDGSHLYITISGVRTTIV